VSLRATPAFRILVGPAVGNLWSGEVSLGIGRGELGDMGREVGRGESRDGRYAISSQTTAMTCAIRLAR
jgi:hypothetical protein